MDHYLLAASNVKKTSIVFDNNDNYQIYQLSSGDIKVENQAETNDYEDWCVENFAAGNFPRFYEQSTEGSEQCSLCLKYFLDQFDLYKHNLSHLQVIINPKYSGVSDVKTEQSITSTLSYKPKAHQPKIETSYNTTLYKNSINSAQKSKDCKKPYECNICHKIYSYKAWHGHMQEVHSKEEHSCQFCDMVFKCKRYLKKHIRNYHKPKHQPKGSMILHKCVECDAVLRNAYALTTHKRNVHGEAYTCHICASTLKCKSYLLTHMRRVHCDDETHECECGKTFRSRRYLMVHKRNAHSQKKKLKTKVKTEQ